MSWEREHAELDAFARSVGGILPGGEAHPTVQASIDSSRADRLSRSVSARAFATGSDVYFARGEYRPGSAAADKQIAHELAHVVQQRGAPSSGPLTVTNPGDAMETEADRVADEIA